MLRISFCITDLRASAVSVKNGKKVLAMYIDGETLICEIAYDFDERPLVLRSEIALGDAVELILLPYRLELWRNGTLADEEWPAGNCLFSPESAVDFNFRIKIEPYSPAGREQPAVLGTFRNADGWRPEEHVFVGDCMPYTHNGRYHVLYLKDRRHHTSKWWLGAHQWEHISTKDFTEWEMHPTAVEITAPHEGSICTGSWINGGEAQYLFYTVRMADRSPAPIMRSVSCDGYHFTKDCTFGFILPERYDGRSARDPKVVLGADGRYHMFLTTSLVKENKGCLAHFTSTDLNEWNDTGVPIYISEDETQPECPDYFRYGNFFYLVFSLHGKAHYRYSLSPFDGWKTPNNPIIPCHNVPKAALWNSKIVFTGYRPLRDGCYAGTMCFVTAAADQNGELMFDTTSQFM